jgi:dolichyl-phosphate beta-glucosyltransferase
MTPAWVATSDQEDQNLMQAATDRAEALATERIPQSPFLSVVIPTYMESARLPRTFEEILPYLHSRFPSFEVIVVDDNSSDGTGDIVRRYAQVHGNIHLLTQPGRLGKGAAVRRGCMAARGQYILFMDADHSTPIQELDQFLPAISSSTAAAVAGVRTYQEGESRARRIIGLLGQVLAHLIVFKKAVVDSQCGFKLFTAEAVTRVFPFARVNGGMLDVELFYLMHKFGVPCRFVPVSWKNKPGSRISILVCMIRDPLDMLRIRVRDLVGVYKQPLPLTRQPWAS